MNRNIKIALLGGDMRQAALASRLGELGFESAVWGLGAAAEDLGDAVRCSSFGDAVSSANALVLPLPVSRDGVYLNCPLCPDCKLELDNVLDSLDRDVLLLGGAMSDKFKSRCAELGITCSDYYDSEELQLKNALPSAEGALEYAMRRLKRTIFGCRAAVIGYGRIAQVLSGMLHALNADVTVFARSSVATTRAGLFGCRAVLMSSPDWYYGLCDSDVIFNTVPVRLFDSEVLKRIGKKPIYIDLVSEPGGVDCEVAAKLGIAAEKALSLPGKVAPITAGNIICDSVLDKLRTYGIIGEKT
jgi:dipicolinate synthase subunit A